MCIAFSKKNKNNVCDALEGKKSYQKLSPAEWHQFVQNYNYDDGNEPFLWLSKQPDLDKGTALCLYWHLSPDFFCGKESDEEDYLLIKEIERRFLDGFYCNEEFAFDPSAEFVTSKTKTSHIPHELLQATKGSPFDRVDVEYAFLRFPNEKETKTIAKKMENGTKIIRQIDPEFLHQNPDDTIKAIKETVDYFTCHDIGKLKIKDLSFLWLDCLCQKYNWDWVMWDWETGANYGVSNPTRALTCVQDTIIRHTIDGFQPTSIISKLYANLCGIHEIRELKKDVYSGIGLLFSSSHLKFKAD